MPGGFARRLRGVKPVAERISIALQPVIIGIAKIMDIDRTPASVNDEVLRARKKRQAIRLGKWAHPAVSPSKERRQPQKRF